MLANLYGAQQRARCARSAPTPRPTWPCSTYAAARDRFKAAQDLIRMRKASGAVPIDHYEASIIDTRARAVEALVREQAAGGRPLK